MEPTLYTLEVITSQWQTHTYPNCLGKVSKTDVLTVLDRGESVIAGYAHGEWKGFRVREFEGEKVSDRSNRLQSQPLCTV